MMRRCVVRLRTETFFKGNAFHKSKTLSLLKRKSLGDSYPFDELMEEHFNICHDVEVENLYSFKDGIYYLLVIYSTYEEQYTFILEEIKDDPNKSN